MGILRADRITGLGGANAIKGSAFFPQNSYIDVSPDAGLDLSGDFTVEMWVYNLPSPQITSHARQISSKNYYQAGSDGNWYFGLNRNDNTSFDITFYSYDGTGSAEYVNGQVGSDLEKWYHIAASRSGSTLKLFVDGVQKASGTLSKGLDDGGNNGLLIGGMAQSGGESSTWGDHYGYISNLRIIKGTALYTAAFTAPAFELSQTSDTTLLCCQSPGNVLQEKTGKILTIIKHYGSGGADAFREGVVATRFTPNSPVGFSTTTDVGSQYGSTFDGFGSFATSTYMVPPGGNTRERNRGRAVIGWANNPVNTGMDVFNIQSLGNTTEFGNLTTGNKWGSHAFSSTTRGLWAGGYINTPASTFFNTIEFVTIATNGNPIDFGDTTTAPYRSGCCSSSTRGIIALGFVAPAFGKVNTIDQVTIATLGNATNFGDLFQTRANMSSLSSPTRGIFAGGETPTYVNTIDYVTIASAGDASNFGDLNSTPISSMAMASNTRGIIGGGYPTPANTNIIDFITIASTGDATDFGDLTGLYSVGSATSNNTRGVFCGGYTAPSKHNLMEFVTIATTGNTSDFGDMLYSRRDFGVCSDSHGGLS